MIEDRQKAHCRIDLSVSGDKVAKKSWKIILFFNWDKKKRKLEDRKESDHKSITNLKNSFRGMSRGENF